MQLHDPVLPAVTSLQPNEPQLVDEVAGRRESETIAKRFMVRYNSANGDQRRLSQALELDERLQRDRKRMRWAMVQASPCDGDGELEGAT